MSLKNKKIILGITGGIAAYKTPALVRLLIKKGAEVRVVTTPAALNFVSKLSLQVVSTQPVLSEFSNADDEWNNHVKLGLWADAMLIAPLTANTLAAMAHGNCSNLLLATYLSARCPVFVAPAMDLDMYKHPTTQENLAKIQSYGVTVIPAASGELASGLYGAGRMEEPENLVAQLENYFSENQLFKNRKILITAGPTYENIDPVRFIGNYSSGKMGYHLAEEAAKMGAEVCLISGPTALEIEHPNITIHRVTSALEMKEMVDKYAPYQEVLIMAAAVADYRVKNIAQNKIKKTSENLQIELIKNPDILKSLGETKKKTQFLVGFALETQNAIENATQKLNAKNADMIVLNTLEDEGAGFQVSTNKVSFITKKQASISFDLKSKKEVAKDILNYIAQNI
ncbi:bifunctional phosphopantothenoylcysteine decarboxylase/phosphopantothenate--cysteine ligase CoaBC [Ornithobacterium rhinotracheale]|uniref:bifunctional phosphopantothenoylcysteine decarboxylase/phosphopantothenate--cysteine ligase CoaBC n=1 Tax=Ornithobacterium rhinotracheale TaxID=28251 RepID=UPI00129CFDB3|nr:bifunctional phosphopantothenoylcysteine decarboxylase/phosphopantothenate--cysteine ligase CoaBC [Ornithobacterium rhinotracheale]MRJ08644.1 bifunctional phosphopantothenoylcysteine decarboxylase/phosphopantothenate--cysteine ligase CoaBC [Ornithobacterium rhinotracheale]UOH76910.1 bifunctional phosphopantothenoylcysteine decarboxylase/phosphopantothenate--cysteine ligase CoaBC [Ornithobacterium rhinotracheale]